MATPENQAKIDWLNRYGKLDREIDRKCEELSRWRSRAEKVTTVVTGMPGGSGAGSQLQDAVDKIMCVEEEINTSIDELRAVREEIEAAIHTVSDETLQTLLQMRYIDGNTFEQIAVNLNYTFRHITRLHRRALQKLLVLDNFENCNKMEEKII